MEENRLKPMPENYDEALFNQIYKETEPLRKSLARTIDPRRFGLFYEDILSFFDVKFIYCFTKYHEENPNKLKATILNSLQQFRNRILRSAYTKKHSQNIISWEILTKEEYNPMYEIIEEKEIYLNKALSFMRTQLSDDAMLLLEIQLNPPPYILDRIKGGINDKKLQKIPDHLLIEYLDLGDSNNSYAYLNRLKKEIKNATSQAKSQLNKEVKKADFKAQLN